MRYLTLGEGGPVVSGLCLGTWALSGFWGADVEPGVAAVRRAFDLGVNFFDTARAYGDGAAEAALARGVGDLLGGHREEIVISTKGGLEQRGETVVRNSDPGHLRSDLLRSLKALGTDYVDVYFVHWPDPIRPLAETADVLRGFVKEGLVRKIGVSNFSAEQMKEFGVADVAQVPYNLFARGVEDAVLPYCRQAGVRVMGWSPLAHGLLAGALRSGHVFAPDDWRAYSPIFQGERFAMLLETVETLKHFAADRGCDVSQLALAWVMASEVIPVVGAQFPEHLEASVRALDVRLSEPEARELTRLVTGVPQVEPDAVPASREPGDFRSPEAKEVV